MAIEEILSALDMQAEAEIDRISNEARAEAEAITQAAQQEADRAGDIYVADAIKEATAAADREKNAEHTAHRRRVADTHREVFEEVFVRAGEKIKSIRTTAEYPAIMSYLVADATADLGSNYILHIDPRDKQLVSEVCKGMACAFDIETAGGVVVTSADGRIRRSSTFEDRLRRISENHIELVSEVLGT